MKELTSDERNFAEENHSRVITFLNVRHLPHDEFYDVVVFGFLKAVVEYLSDSELREHYKFSTIANRKMKDALYSDYRYRNRLIRHDTALSLDYVNDSGYTLHDEVPSRNTALEALEMVDIVNELSEWLSPIENAVIQLRMQGYAPWEISHELKLQPPEVHELMHNARNTVFAVCA